MKISMQALSVEVFATTLGNLSSILEKGLAHATQRKFDPAVLLAARLAPDMLPLTRQVQIACDLAKNSVARLAAQEPPRFEDNETSFEQLRLRIARVIDYLKSVPADALAGSETRDIRVPTGQRAYEFKGLEFLQPLELVGALPRGHPYVACLRARERVRRHALQVVDHARDTEAQLLEGGLVVLEARRLLSGEPRDGILGEVAGNLHLPRQRQHVGCQARSEQHCRVELALRGVRQSLLEDRGEISESGREHFHRERLHRDLHERVSLPSAGRSGPRAREFIRLRGPKVAPTEL